MIIRWLHLLYSLAISILFVFFIVPIKEDYAWFVPLVFIGSLFAFYLLYFFTLWIISLFFSKKKIYTKQNPIFRFFLDQTMTILCHFGRVKIVKENLELLPKEKYLLVYNHNSDFDNIIESVVLHSKNFLHISKPGNMDIPIAGPFIRRNLFLAINREDAKEAIKTLNKAADYIENDEFSIGISPEGTRNKTGKGLLPFRNGAFKLAFYAKCPIVVCSLHNTNQIHKNFPWRETKAIMRIVKVYSYEDYKDKNTNQLSQEIKELFIKDLDIKQEDIQ